MDYEKAYKDTLAKAREIHRNEDEKRSDMEWLFPELKNKDEEIRKALIKGVESCKASGWTNFGNNVDIDVVLAWLKEQGKQKPIDYNKELKKCRENPLYFFDKYVKLEKQKPACSEEDERVKKRILLSLEKDLMATKNSGCDTQDLEQCIAWLEKQGQTFTKKDVDDAYLKGIYDAKNELEKQGKSSDQIHYWTEEEIEPIIHDYLRGVEHYGGMIGRLRCLKPKSLEKQGGNPAPININKMVMEYSQTKDGDFGLPVNCQIRAYRQGLTDAISTLNFEKQGNSSVKWQKNTLYNKPAVNHSILMKTIQGIAEGEWQGEHWFQYRWSWTFKDSEVLAWMELSDLNEQGEQKPAVTDFNAKDWYVSKVDGKIHDMTYNPADKVEPKFHEGEWIVWKNKCYKVNYNGCGYELIDQNGLSTWLEYGTVDTSARLYDITKDAKDGDVVIDKSDGTIGIFEGIGHHPNGGSYNDPSYCFLHCRYDDGFFYADFENGNIMDSGDVIPATKEQRDTLMKAMADAGYTFDFEKKELKKIEDEIEIPFGAKDSELQEATYYIPDGFHAEIDDDKVVIKKGEKSAAWSEEDEEFLRRAINATKDVYPVTANFLKSLKDRATWKPSEKQMEALHNLNLIGKIDYVGQAQALIELYNDLKKL